MNIPNTNIDIKLLALLAALTFALEDEGVKVEDLVDDKTNEKLGSIVDLLSDEDKNKLSEQMVDVLIEMFKEKYAEFQSKLFDENV